MTQWQITKKELLVQGLRYLAAAEQDTHPAYGLIHASYARLIFEGLAYEGDFLPRLLRRAGELQEKWTQVILAKHPLPLWSDPSLKQEIAKVLSPVRPEESLEGV